MDGKREEQDTTDFLRERKKLMPEPNRFAEWGGSLEGSLATPVWVSEDKVAAIKPGINCGGR